MTFYLLFTTSFSGYAMKIMKAFLQSLNNFYYMYHPKTKEKFIGVYVIFHMKVTTPVQTV